MPLDSKARRPKSILANHIKAQVVVSPTWRRLCRVCYTNWANTKTIITLSVGLQ